MDKQTGSTAEKIVGVFADALGLPPGDKTPHGRGRPEKDAGVPPGTLTSEGFPESRRGACRPRGGSRPPASDLVAGPMTMASDEAMQAVARAVKDMWVDQEARAAAELSKADEAAHEAADRDRKDGARSQVQKIEEAKGHTEALGRRAAPRPAAQLPSAAPLVVAGHNDEGWPLKRDR